MTLPQAEQRGRDHASVLVAPTAYNWMSVARDAAALSRDGHSSTSAMLELVFETETAADAAFAVLSSKLLLWLWRVESDGFHVTKSFVLDAPFDLRQLSAVGQVRLADAGAQLWSEAVRSPTLSVNRGRTTVGYATSALAGSAAVDQAVASAFGLPAHVCDAVRSWHDNLLVVDFAEKRRVAAASARRMSA
jgi:hypothetical protein